MIDEEFSNYFVDGSMAIKEVEEATDFRSNKEKKNEMIECLVQGEDDEHSNYYAEIPR